jgi:hypothetical protein
MLAKITELERQRRESQSPGWSVIVPITDSKKTLFHLYRVGQEVHPFPLEHFLMCSGKIREEVKDFIKGQGCDFVELPKNGRRR